LWLKSFVVANPTASVTAMSEACSLLSWDSNHWGFATARINVDRLTADLAEHAIRWCEGRQVKCLYFAADGACAETLENAHSHGFKFVDVRVDMEWTLAGEFPENAVGSVCRVAVPDDLAAIEKLARTAHQDTRFFKDRAFDARRAADLYALWIARDYREGPVFVAVSPVQPDHVLGYLSVGNTDRDEGRIGLVAVTPEARGRGVGRQLVQHALAWLQLRGVKRVRVATQGTNVSALRLYESCGFRAAEVKFWFHRWFDF
jgi:dTDP-4-amino-4,6-dideoxy-D-galactose acyltransferase